MSRVRIAAIDRTLPRCIETREGCWEFLGARSAAGYGVVGLGGKAAGLAYTHRLAFDYFVGDIPDGLDLDHLCRNRACCNPWHLEPVTRQVNASRGDAALGSHRGLHTHCSRGHALTGENVIVTPKQRYCRICRTASNRRAQAKFRGSAQ